MSAGLLALFLFILLALGFADKNWLNTPDKIWSRSPGANNVIGGIPITKKQRYLAGRTDLVALLRSRGETLKKLGSEWEWKFHDERVTIRGHLWFDQYTQKGGDAVDFFRYFYGESEEQAAAMLLNCSVQDLEKLPARSPPRGAPTTDKQEKTLEIPPAHSNMRRAFAYLCQTRGIAPEVVSAFARKGLLYESADHHNAVFVGRDEQGEIRHLHARGTLTGSHFRQTLPGSEKEYSFHWPGTSGKLYAFEAPIDLLSYISLHPEGWQDHSYVALCGVSAAPIHHLLETQPQLQDVTLCLDNDKAGHNAARRIAGELLREWNVTMSAEFPTLKDWNDELLANHQEETQGLTMSM